MKKKVNFTVKAALIGASYALATYLCSLFSISFGPLQLRLSEALTALCALTGAAIPGLTIGCIIANFASPYGLYDIIFGSLATLLAGIAAYKLRNIKFKGLPLLSFFMPVIFNALIIGAETVFLMPGAQASLMAFLINAGEIALGETIICLIGGIPLYSALNKTKIFKEKSL